MRKGAEPVLGHCHRGKVEKDGAEGRVGQSELECGNGSALMKTQKAEHDESRGEVAEALFGHEQVSLFVCDSQWGLLAICPESRCSDARDETG